MTLPERMVEAAARAIYHANLREEATPWDDLVAGYSDKPGTLGYRALQRCRDKARAALTAALAVAEAEGVWLVKVVGNSETTDCANPYPAGVTNSFAAYNEGFDDHRAATLAGRVTL